ncbi:MAG: hypothetical protein KatS3mg027_0770 [Bacteroidia bacterium]|nr:MAG: hypothetical protein KatS3mg027_0770 [Bacteroidia bacterium]
MVMFHNRLFKSLISYCLILLNIFWMYGQKAESILDNLHITEINGKIQILCTITSGKTCQGIEVWRKNEGEEYKRIGDIKGICGSISAPVSYTFTDANPPKNETLNYKLYLGGYGYSEPIEIKIVDYRELSYKVIPNPASDLVRIYINSSNSTISNNYILHLYSPDGQKVLTQDVNSSNGYFEIPVLNLHNGVYYFKILNTSENIITSGKLYVNH